MTPWLINPNNLNEDFRQLTYPNVMQNMYMVSNLGSVYNIVKNFNVGQYINLDGYKKCNLLNIDGIQRSYSIHRLVAWEFVPYRRDITLHINHIDCNKLNNDPSNLEWVTPLENLQHATLNGLRPHLRGELNGCSKLTTESVHHICKLLEDDNISYLDICKIIEDTYDIKISPDTLRKIASSKLWSHISNQYNIPHRNRKGVNASRSILNDEVVNYICKALENPNVHYDKLINDVKESFNIDIGFSALGAIANHRSWTHISDEYNIPQRIRIRSRLLNEEIVHFICQEFLNPKTSTIDVIRKVKERFNIIVSQQCISDILYNRYWTDIRSLYNIPSRDRSYICKKAFQK